MQASATMLASMHRAECRGLRRATTPSAATTASAANAKKRIVMGRLSSGLQQDVPGEMEVLPGVIAEFVVGRQLDGVLGARLLAVAAEDAAGRLDHEAGRVAAA